MNYNLRFLNRGFYGGGGRPKSKGQALDEQALALHDAAPRHELRKTAEQLWKNDVKAAKEEVIGGNGLYWFRVAERLS